MSEVDELAAAIDPVLECVRLDHPIELSDIAALRQALGDIPGLEVHHRFREVEIAVYRGGQATLRRRLVVHGAPAMMILRT